MKKAGEYNCHIEQLRQTYTRLATTGEELESWEVVGELWAKIEFQSGSRAIELGGMQTGVDAIISVRNFPTVTPLDRFSFDDQIYLINHIRKGDNELICDCQYFDGDIINND